MGAEPVTSQFGFLPNYVELYIASSLSSRWYIPFLICSLQVRVVIHLRNLQNWRVFFLSFFFTLLVWVYHLSEVKSSVYSSIYLLSGSFLWGLPSSILRIVLSIFQGVPSSSFDKSSPVDLSFVSLRYSFVIFSFIFTYLMVSASNILKYL